jgi:hypothetical protein
MPVPPSKRDYRAEYDKYQGTPKQRRNNDKRKQARRDYEAKHGNLPSTTEIDHKRALINGGSNAAGNTRAIPRAKNRGFSRGKSNRPKGPA